MSILPNFCATTAASACTDSRSLTSQATVWAWPPKAERLEAVASRVVSVRPHSTTVAPSDATLSAMAAPMPRPAPVTTATCPERGVLGFMEVAPEVSLAAAITGISRFASKIYEGVHEERRFVRTNLRKLKHIHIIPLTGTKLLPVTAEGVLSIPGHALGEYRAEIHSHLDSALQWFPAVRFPRTRGAIGMKTTLLAIVLAVAFSAAAHVATQAQTAPAAPASGDNQAPTIKDAAER